MPSPQQNRSPVPLDQQSVLPTVRGVPWWGAVLLATGITAVGAMIDSSNTESLGSVYKFCYLVGCIVAALAVRRRALFTAAAQPPLVAFFVSIVTLYTINSDQAKGLKNLIFKVLLPIAADFPWMATTFIVTLVLVIARWYLTRDNTDPKGSRRTDRPRDDDSPRTAKRTRTGEGATARTDDSRTGKARPQKPRTQEARGTKTADKRRPAAGERPADKARTADKPGMPKTGKPGAGTSKSKPGGAGKPTGGRPTRPPRDADGAAPDAPRRPRATAGQAYRAESGRPIDPDEAAPRAPKPSAAADLDPYESATADQAHTPRN